VPDLPFFGLPERLIAWQVKTLDMHSLLLATQGIAAA
jgi:hypothetical protein